MHTSIYRILNNWIYALIVVIDIIANDTKSSQPKCSDGRNTVETANKLNFGSKWFLTECKIYWCSCLMSHASCPMHMFNVWPMRRRTSTIYNATNCWSQFLMTKWIKLNKLFIDVKCEFNLSSDLVWNGVFLIYLLSVCNLCERTTVKESNKSNKWQCWKWELTGCNVFWAVVAFSSGIIKYLQSNDYRNFSRNQHL